jgi:hypothetical protein
VHHLELEILTSTQNHYGINEERSASDYSEFSSEFAQFLEQIPGTLGQTKT